MWLTSVKVNCLSSSVSFDAAWYQPSLFDRCLVPRNSDSRALPHGFYTTKKWSRESGEEVADIVPQSRSCAMPKLEHMSS